MHVTCLLPVDVLLTGSSAQGFPTLLMFSKGKMYTYDGGRDFESLYDWCKDRKYRKGESVPVPKGWDQMSVMDKAMEVFEKTIKSDMESMGLIGPFYTATLPEGRLQFASASLDGMFTDAPTVTASPSESPSMVPSTAEPTREIVEDVVLCHYYPHFKTETCVNDCMQGEFQKMLFSSLAKCVS